jgi:hypothetical protein
MRILKEDDCNFVVEFMTALSSSRPVWFE